MEKIIALDIDGTITAEKHALSSAVLETFIALKKQGWNFIFATGRPYPWSHATLAELPFPYALAIQNGALTLAMPSQSILDRCYVSFEKLTEFYSLMKKWQKGFAVYGGYEAEDRCFYFSSLCSAQDLHYIKCRAALLNEDWVPLNSIEELPFTEFPALKFFSLKDEAIAISKEIEQQLNLHAPVILDPFRDPEFTEAYYVVQSTSNLADKGKALERYIERHAKNLTSLIVAGNDMNDLSLFTHFPHAQKIAMQDSPEELKTLADIIAPSAIVDGIVIGLQKAKEKLEL